MGVTKNFSAEILYNIFVAILENQCPHKVILSLTDLEFFDSKTFYFFMFMDIYFCNNVIKQNILLFVTFIEIQ